MILAPQHQVVGSLLDIDFFVRWHIVDIQFNVEARFKQFPDFVPALVLIYLRMLGLGRLFVASNYLYDLCASGLRTKWRLVGEDLRPVRIKMHG